MRILFWISTLLILHVFILYPISLIILEKFISSDRNVKDDYIPKVSIVIAAHNEEKVIERKLINLIGLDYPKEKMEIIVASDFCTDKTNSIVEGFKKDNNLENLYLYKSKVRAGKTNAQNECVKYASGEILIFSDANSILRKNCILELVKYFYDRDISYVTGKLVYTNDEKYITSNTEGLYWKYDLFIRKCENQIASITAGNGAVYAVRKIDYIYIDDVYSHDSMLPIRVVLNGKKAKYCESAIAYEKAGENTKDEFKRKIRMNRKNFKILYSDLQKYNPFKCGWFSYFYFSHRYLRNSLCILQLIFLISNICILKYSDFYSIVLCLQIIFYITAIIGIKIKKRIFYLPLYYCMMIISQFIGYKNEITGKSKGFWEKAESTR